MSTAQGATTTSSSFREVSGDVVGALGIIHALGLNTLEPDLEALEQALPVGTRTILRWRLPSTVRDNADAIADYPTDMLLEAARLIGDEGRRSIELQELPTWRDPEWFVNAIGTAELLAPGGVYVFHREPGRRAIWQWPLKVGFMDDPAGKELCQGLAEVQAGGGWRERSVKLLCPPHVGIDSAIVVAPSADLAMEVLPHGEPPVRCGLLLVLNWDGALDFSNGAVERGRRVLEHTWAGGVGFADVGRGESEQFFFDMVRGLSHNESIGRSLVLECQRRDLPYPIVVSSTALMRDSRLKRVVGSLRRQMNHPMILDPPLDKPDVEPPYPPPPYPIFIEEPPGSMRDLERELEAMERDDQIFEHEGDFSMDLADAADAVEASVRASPAVPESEGPRRLHGSVFESNGTPLHDAFVAGQRHRIEVGIGTPPPEAIQPEVSVPFPEDLLPPDQELYELTVVFAELSGPGAPASTATELATQTLTLPRGSGNSGTASFDFTVPRDARSFAARVIVLYRDRMLQTANLRGPVGSPADDGGDSRIRFEVEAMVSRYLSGLDDRLRLGHALLFNRNPDGRPGLTASADGRVHISVPQGLPEQLDKLNRKVSTMAHDAETYTGKLEENPDLLQFMIGFARDGADLRDIIERSIGAGSGFDSKKPIQVLAKTEGTQIPIEFLYDYEAPRTNAGLCAGAAGLIDDLGQCSHPHSREVFCPSGFWGLNRIIERHEYTPDAPDLGFVLQNEVTDLRRTIPVRGQALFAGTKVVDDALGPTQGLPRIKKALDSLTDQRCAQASSWEEWETVVVNEGPGLLVLIVHTEWEPLPFDEQKMEIGDDRWLLYNDIREDVVNGGADMGPLVLLIGCETGHAKVRYQALSEKFKREGAAIVVSSGATIHSRHAVPVVEALVALLEKGRDDQPVAFGEIMRRMRCRMLAQGIPIILCVTASGDADWLLT